MPFFNTTDAYSISIRAVVKSDFALPDFKYCRRNRRVLRLKAAEMGGWQAVKPQGGRAKLVEMTASMDRLWLVT
jgi:hypothetical protein